MHITAKGILGHAIATLGRTYDYATPGKGTSFATNLGRNMYGRYNDTNNPGYAKNSIVQAPKAPPSQPTLDYSTYDPYGGGSSYGGSTGGSPSYAAPDPTPGLRQTATNTINAILHAYDLLSGNIDSSVADRANQLNSNYDTQAQDLNKAYENSQGQTGAAYAARGLGQSSFLGDAMGQNADVYNQNNQQMITDRNSSLADLGKYAATSKAGVTAGKAQYGNILGQLGNYDATALNSLIPQLQQADASVQGQAAGIGSDQNFINGLNAITPVQNHGADQLATRLSQLVQSGAPKFAKQQLANGLIKQAQLTDPNQASYWQNYFSQLLNGA